MTGDPAADDPRFERWIRRNTPMQRLGDAHELDGALLFLASDAGSFVTGQTIAVDGGFTA
jgi:NAD(P)-dependent dehydrogenase (short-subunit alcohol dehydrogenase family)